VLFPLQVQQPPLGPTSPVSGGEGHLASGFEIDIGFHQSSGDIIACEADCLEPESQTLNEVSNIPLLIRYEVDFRHSPWYGVRERHQGKTKQDSNGPIIRLFFLNLKDDAMVSEQTILVASGLFVIV